MHDTTVKMKDGRTFCGPIWSWRPADGWFSIVDSDSPDRIHFRDVESVVTKGQRTHPGIIEDQDELARARDAGWTETKGE